MLHELAELYTESLSSESSECNKSDYTKRSRNWVFTTEIEGKDLSVHLKRGSMANIFIGPREDPTSLPRKNTPPTAHGLIMFSEEEQGKRPSARCRSTVLKILQQQNIPIYNQYLAPLKQSLSSYVTYAFKQELKSIPDRLLKLAKIPDGYKLNVIVEVAAKGYATYSERPAYTEWHRYMTMSLGLHIQEQAIKRTYDQWPKSFDKALKVKLAKFKRLRKKYFTVEEIISITSEILSKTLVSASWEGHVLSAEELLVAMTATQLEMRLPDIINAPHWLFYGQAGAGKTLLSRFIFPDNLCSGMPNDSEGVGAIAMDTNSAALKLEDAGDKFWRNSGLLASIKEMYHNSWHAKIHGSKQRNHPTCCIITTNDKNPMISLSAIDDSEAWEQRFILMSFKGRYVCPLTTREYTMDLLEKYWKHSLDKCMDLDEDKIVLPSIKAMYADIVKYMTMDAEDVDIMINDIDTQNDPRKRARQDLVSEDDEPCTSGLNADNLMSLFACNEH